MKLPGYMHILFVILFFASCRDLDNKRLENGLITYYADDGSGSGIFIMKSDGSMKHKMISDGASNRSGCWSPDGKNMVFTSNKEGNREIYFMDAYGNHRKRITVNSTDDLFPQWSPDCRQIIFIATRDGNNEIYTMNADGSGQKNISNTREDEFFPCWSPSGKKIIFSLMENEKIRIFQMDTDGKNRTRVTSYTGPDDELSARYSPNGKNIIFYRKSPSGDTQNIFLVRSNGKGTRQLTSTGTDGFPSWSPDGKFIVFQSKREGIYQIWKMNSDGTDPIPLSNNDRNEYMPFWSWIQDY